MGTTVTAEPTAGERFGSWLANAMRRADMDIDRQMGGGRSVLADAVGVSRSTVTRWMSGRVLPSAEQFEPLAKALGVYVDDMLVDSGIVDRAQMSPREGKPTAPRPTSYELERAAEILGVPPGKRRTYVQLMKSMAALTGSQIVGEFIGEQINDMGANKVTVVDSDADPSAG